jgi:predicted TIM-barrel fold metal-dependent hydrolase
MDQEFHKYAGKLQDYQLSELPSTLFRRQVIATYEDEPMSIRLIPFIGVDNVMWASDYPHADSTWPHSREAVDKQFAGMPAEIKRKVTHDTCKRIYRFA